VRGIETKGPEVEFGLPSLEPLVLAQLFMVEAFVELLRAFPRPLTYFGAGKGHSLSHPLLLFCKRETASARVSGTGRVFIVAFSDHFPYSQTFQEQSFTSVIE
jgi:hypothetical protein